MTARIDNPQRRRADEAAASATLPIEEQLAAGAPVAVAIVALASVEIVNAAYGRDVGDAVVLAAEERIAAAAPGWAITRDGPVFTLARGGDTLGAVAAIEQALAMPFAIDARKIHIGSRIGVARSAEGERADAVMARARLALGEAQAADGATTRFARPLPAAPVTELAADLHRGITAGEIDVLFQPQVALADGRVAGVEALARWRHPRLGELGAETLLAASDRAGLGLALSDHIHDVALARVAAWPRVLADLRVALNVTAADIARADFVPRFLARIDARGIARDRITVEVTEGGLIDDTAAATAALDTLRGAGCRVALDDFGTGYSSLAYLTALPIDYLKIDRSLTHGITGDRRHRVVVEGVIAMAAALGMETIAEGVETVDQRDLLATRGCTYYQGFLYAGALDSGALASLVERRA